MYIHNIDKLNNSSVYECNWFIGKYIETVLGIPPLNKNSKKRKYVFARTKELENSLFMVSQQYKR